MSQGFESFKADGSVGFNSASRTLFFQSDTAVSGGSSQTLDFSALASRNPSAFVSGASLATLSSYAPWGYASHNVDTLSAGVFSLTPQTFEAYGYYTATYPDSRVDTFLLG